VEAAPPIGPESTRTSVLVPTDLILPTHL